MTKWLRWALVFSLTHQTPPPGAPGSTAPFPSPQWRPWGCQHRECKAEGNPKASFLEKNTENGPSLLLRQSTPRTNGESGGCWTGRLAGTSWLLQKCLQPAGAVLRTSLSEHLQALHVPRGHRPWLGLPGIAQLLTNQEMRLLVC